MKKYALIISLTVLSLLFSQCKKEVITENGTSPVNGTFTLTANIDNGGSKTDITAAGAVTWKTNDKIYVVSKTTGVLGFVECTEDGTTFTGNITVGNGEECYFYFLGSSRTDVANGTASINIEEFATQAGTLAGLRGKFSYRNGSSIVSQ